MDSPWALPRLLAVVLAVTVVITGVWAASTSAGAFDAYNRGWEGASELRDEADAAGASPFVATSVDAYGTVDPNGTVAVVLSPDERYTDAEAARLRQFARAGGTLVVAEDFGSHSNPLLARLGASTRVDGGLLRDERNYYRSPNIPIATGVANTTLTGGADRLTLNYGTVLDPDGATVLARTSSFAYVDANRNGSLDADESLGRYPVATAEDVGTGLVVTVSDPSLFINAMIERQGNSRFTRGLFGGAETVLLDYSHAGRIPPLAAATLAFRRNPLLQGGVGLLLVGVAVGVGTVLSGGGRDARSGSRERLREGLARRHPEWSAERVDRLMAGIINEETKWEEDD